MSDDSTSPVIRHTIIDRADPRYDRRENDAMANMLAALERRVDEHQRELPALIAAAITASVGQRLPTADEQMWVRMAIQREAQSIALRRAIIEKSLVGLAWFMIGVLGLIIKDYATLHGWKP